MANHSITVNLNGRQEAAFTRFLNRVNTQRESHGQSVVTFDQLLTTRVNYLVDAQVREDDESDREELRRRWEVSTPVQRSAALARLGGGE